MPLELKQGPDSLVIYSNPTIILSLIGFLSSFSTSDSHFGAVVHSLHFHIGTRFGLTFTFVTVNLSARNYLFLNEFIHSIMHAFMHSPKLNLL